jgi:short-subunit dehydrogenase
MKKYILITGASTGIGKSIAEFLAKNGFHVFASVRKEADGEKLAKISENITPVLLDVTNHDSIIEAKKVIVEKLAGQKLFSLINNAGIAVAGPVEFLPMEELRYQFDVNFFGLVDVTQVFLSLMDDKESKIINMSSVAGRISQPFMAPYTASKHAVEALSDSLRRELLATGIDVIVIQPGVITTPIWEKAEEIKLETYKGTRYETFLKNLKEMMNIKSKGGLPAERVAELVLKILNSKKPKTRYLILRRVFADALIPSWLPDRVLDKAVKRILQIK